MGCFHLKIRRRERPRTARANGHQREGLQCLHGGGQGICKSPESQGVDYSRNDKFLWIYEANDSYYWRMTDTWMGFVILEYLILPKINLFFLNSSPAKVDKQLIF